MALKCLLADTSASLSMKTRLCDNYNLINLQALVYFVTK